MPKGEKFTVIVLPEGADDRVRRFEVSGKLIGSFGALAVVSLLVISMGLLGLYMGVKSSSEMSRLRDSNEQYKQTIAGYEAAALDLDARLESLELSQDRMKQVYQVETKEAVVEPAKAEPAAPNSGVGGRGGPEGLLLGHQSPSLQAQLPIYDLLNTYGGPAVIPGPFGRMAERLGRVGREQSRLQVAIDAKKEELSFVPSIRPVDEGWVSSSFGKRISPFTEVEQFHHGLDISAERGVPIYATGAGTIRYAGRANGMGLMVEIDHGSDLRTRYGHCDRLFVRSGEKVKRGDRIGNVGMTGNTTGPHVHYEVLKNLRPVDPAKYILN